MIRQLLADGYYPKKSGASGLVEFHEFIAVAPKKVFWTLQIQPERRELYDEDKLIGTASDEAVQLGSDSVEAVLRNGSFDRGQYYFGAYSLFHADAEIPFFLTTYDPRSGWESKRLLRPTFLTSVPNSVLKCKENCVFIYDQDGVLLAQFLFRKKHPIARKDGKGTIHVRADLEAQVQFELTAALFGMTILF